jgi:hypothetical protein
MVQDLTMNQGDYLTFTTMNGKDVEVKGVLSATDLEFKEYCDDINSFDLSTTGEVSFTMKNKQWYRLQKSLGLVKPVYKKKRKGKRYIWYEVVPNIK